MAVEVTGATNLKPLPSVHGSKLAQLTVFDRAACDFHITSLYAFLPPTPSNSSLISGLSRVLSFFPHLAGRIVVNGRLRPCISLNNAGVLVVEANVPAALSMMLPLEATSNLAELHPSIDDGVKELLQIQLNRYTCGGLVIGTTSHHRVADGQSMSLFFTAWAQMVRTGSPPNPPPFVGREATFVPRNPPRCDFNHGEIEFQSHAAASSKEGRCAAVENLRVQFSADFIVALKSLVPGRCSTFEALLAHLWRKISLARGLHDSDVTKVRVAVNGRGRLKSLPVPMEFFGNLVLWAHPKATIGELTSAAGGGQANAVRIIHEAVEGIDDGYFRSFIDFGEVKNGEAELVAAVPTSLEVDSWLRFNFHKLDFGGGPPCSFLPPNMPVEGTMIFVPSMKEKGGVDVFMALAAQQVNGFKSMCYSFD